MYCDFTTKVILWISEVFSPTFSGEPYIRQYMLLHNVYAYINIFDRYNFDIVYYIIPCPLAAHAPSSQHFLFFMYSRSNFVMFTLFQRPLKKHTYDGMSVLPSSYRIKV